MWTEKQFNSHLGLHDKLRVLVENTRCEQEYPNAQGEHLN